MISIALILGCHREAAPPPDLAATVLPIDAGVDARVAIDPFGGNPPPRPLADGGIVSPRCADAKHGGWGGSLGTCGADLKYRCGATRFEVACSNDGKRGAICICKKDGRDVGTIEQPRERCGNANGAGEVCGFPPPW